MTFTARKIPKVRVLDLAYLNAPETYFEGPATEVVFDALPSVAFYVVKLRDGWAVREAKSGKSAGVSRARKTKSQAIEEQGEIVFGLAKDGTDYAHAAKLFAEVIETALAKDALA